MDIDLWDLLNLASAKYIPWSDEGESLDEAMCRVWNRELPRFDDIY